MSYSWLPSRRSDWGFSSGGRSNSLLERNPRAGGAQRLLEAACDAYEARPIDDHPSPESKEGVISWGIPMTNPAVGTTRNGMLPEEGRTQFLADHANKWYLKSLPLFLVVLTLWLGGVVGGFALLLRYASTPGGSGPSPAHWPDNSVLVPEPDRANLVLLAHPRCPCTRATMDELERLLDRTGTLLTVHVLFYRPAGSADSWGRTDLWSRACRLPNVHVYDDEDGAQAHLFGAMTSGQAVLYHADGRKLFSGGITDSRGHAGPGRGTQAILSLLTRGSADQEETPVYGCPLAGQDTLECEGNQPCHQSLRPSR
jgi:hypothetical protein